MTVVLLHKQKRELTVSFYPLFIPINVLRLSSKGGLPKSHNLSVVSICVNPVSNFFFF